MLADIGMSLMEDAKAEALKEREELQYNVLMLHEIFTLLNDEIKFDKFELLFALLMFADEDNLNQLCVDSAFL